MAYTNIENECICAIKSIFAFCLALVLSGCVVKGQHGATPWINLRTMRVTRVVENGKTGYPNAKILENHRQFSAGFPVVPPAADANPAVRHAVPVDVLDRLQVDRSADAIVINTDEITAANLMVGGQYLRRFVRDWKPFTEN